MTRTHFLLTAIILFGLSCRDSKQSQPLVVHVWRDPSATFAERLRRVDWQFALTKPHLKSGAGIVVGTTEGGFHELLERMGGNYYPEILIIDSDADLPEDAAIRQQLGKPQLVCGKHLAFIPSSISGDARAAAELYLQFVVAQCVN